MIHCTGCGAALRYDIGSGKLHCDYCGKSIEVDEHPFTESEAKQDVYEVTVFACPTCGGEILSSDHAAIGYCPYCHETSLLEGRLEQKQKPEYIIPFSVTRENCRETYLKTAKKVWCLPREMKDEKCLEHLTGIYMPYWIYHVTQAGEVSLQGSYHVSGGRGGTDVKCYYEVEIENDFPWLCFDAASAFPDESSENINLYSREEAKPFSSAYMSGFYADAADVDADLYQEEAEKAAVFMCLEGMSHYSNENQAGLVELDEHIPEKLHTKTVGVSKGMFPVWFFTWRKKYRRAFGVVNGANGAISTNLPVSPAGFLLMTVLMAIPLTFVFMGLLHVTASWNPIWMCALGLLGLLGILSLHNQTMHECVYGYETVRDTGKDAEKKSDLLEGTYSLEHLSAMDYGVWWGPLKTINFAGPRLRLGSKGQKSRKRMLIENLLAPFAFVAMMGAYTVYMIVLDVAKGNSQTWDESVREFGVAWGQVINVIEIAVVVIFLIRLIVVLGDLMDSKRMAKDPRILVEVAALNVLPIIPIAWMIYSGISFTNQLLTLGILFAVALLSCVLQMFHINRHVTRTATEYHKS